MGNTGSSAESTTNIKTKSIVDALAENIMKCQSNTLVNQLFHIKGNYNTVSNTKQVQHVKLSSECSQDVKNIADLQQAVSNAIKQAASSQSVSLIGVLGSSQSEVDLNIENEVRQNIKQSTVLDIITNTNAMQQMIIEGSYNIVNSFEQSQTLELLFNNCQKVLNNLKSVQEIENQSEQSSEAKQTNAIAEIVDSIFSGLFGLGFLWVIIIVVAIGVGAYVVIKANPFAILFGSSDDADDSDSDDE